MDVDGRVIKWRSQAIERSQIVLAGGIEFDVGTRCFKCKRLGKTHPLSPVK